MHDTLKELETDLAELAKRKSENAIATYTPYPTQCAFHALGATKRERLMLGANQSGKTICGGSEASYHLTGRYPDWWKGRRFDKPTRGWAVGVTGESTRDNPQRILLGPPQDREAWGTGSIPKKHIVGTPTLSRGVADAVDSITVQHVTGGNSVVAFKSYERGREKLQGESLDWVWEDEEPDDEIHSELLARISARIGILFMTATPLKGMSAVVRRFLTEDNPDRGHVTLDIAEAAHISPEEREKVIAGYKPHERDARAHGKPMLGSGAVFPIDLKLITVEPFETPIYWPVIGGLDFGWDHPTAGTRLAWDRDADCIYVTHCYKQREATPVIHAAALKPWGKRMRWAWPHDGLQHDKGSGKQLAQQYRDNGLLLLPEHAQFEDGSFGVEAGISKILERMQTARFKVFSTCDEWFDEARQYHRKDGKIIKEYDDLMAATRYGVMCIRHARNAQWKRHNYDFPQSDERPFAWGHA